MRCLLLQDFLVNLLAIRVLQNLHGHKIIKPTVRILLKLLRHAQLVHDAQCGPHNAHGTFCLGDLFDVSCVEWLNHTNDLVDAGDNYDRRVLAKFHKQVEIHNNALFTGVDEAGRVDRVDDFDSVDLVLRPIVHRLQHLVRGAPYGNPMVHFLLERAQIDLLDQLFFDFGVEVGCLLQP